MQNINKVVRADVEAFQNDMSELGNALNRYQALAGRSAIYPGKGTPLGLAYVALKLNGEAGEVAENVGKAMRDDDIITDGGRPGVRVDFNELTPERRDKIRKELGDTLWYVAAMASEIGDTLSGIAVDNLYKLADRSERGVLQGSGSER